MKNDELFRKFKSCSNFNPVKERLAEIILQEDTNNKEALAYKEALESTEDFNNFTEIFTLHYLALNTKDLISLPYSDMLKMNSCMAKLYNDTNEVSSEFEYEEVMKQLVSDINNSSEDVWKTFSQLKEFVICAYKLELLNFELDEYIEYFFKIYEHLVVKEAKDLQKIEQDRMNAFGEQVYLKQVSANQERILKSVIYNENPYEVLAPVLRNKGISLEDKIEITDFFCRMREDLDITYYKALVQKNPEWLKWLTPEVVQKLHDFAAEYFARLDCSLLSEEMADYLIMYNLYNKGSIKTDDVIKLMSPLVLARSEINEKIERFQSYLQEVSECSEK